MGLALYLACSLPLLEDFRKWSSQYLIALLTIQHGQHHAATGHMTRDQVFVPRTRSQLGYSPVKEDEEIQGIK